MKRALFPIVAFAALLCSFALCLAPAQAQSYKLTDTGHVGDNEVVYGVAQSISPNGVVGGYSQSSFYTGYRWQNGAISQLDDIKDASGFTVVRGINSAGLAVGSCSDYFSPYSYAAKWQGTAVTALGSLGDGKQEADAFAINDNGLVVGWSRTAYDGQVYAATYDGAWHALPYIAGAPANAYAEAHAVNASGEAAGHCDGGDGNWHATLWKGGKAYDLGLFGGTRSQAEGMNDAGQVVGWYQTAPDADGNTQDRAFLWTPGTANGTTGTMQDIGVLPGGSSAYAYDINNNGQVVGYSYSASAAGYAFVWDAAHGMQDLTKLVTSISTEIQPNNGNFYLTDAAAINDNGQIAADFIIFIDNGSGDYVKHGCLLDPGGAVVTKPTAPNNLKVVGGAQAAAAQFIGGPIASATGKISLTWTDNSSNETSFVLQRSVGTGSFADFQTLAANTTSYADGTVTVGTSYGYRVRAANSAGSSSYSNTATATASAPSTVSISSVVLTPTSVTAGQTSTGKITLSAAAPTGGVTITLKSSDTSSATVPASVTIAAGNKSISFTVTSKSVTSTKTVTITAMAGSSSKTATLTVTPATTGVTIQSLSVSPTSVAGGASSTGTITLSGPAPAGGLSVTQKSSDTSAATLAGTVNIAAGATSAKFKITTYAVTSTKMVTITSSAVGVSKTATLTVTGTGGTGTVTAKSLTATPSSVSSNGQTACTLTLSGAAPSGGASVSISANGTMFYTATVTAGQTSTTFNVNWGVVSSTSTNTLSAAYGGKTVTATVTVSPTTVTLKAFTFYPNPVTGGQNAEAKVSLTSKAPAGGAVINITYNGAAHYQFVIPAGQFDGIYAQPTSATTSTQAFVFVANYNGASISKTLTVNP